MNPTVDEVADWLDEHGDLYEEAGGTDLGFDVDMLRAAATRLRLQEKALEALEAFRELPILYTSDAVALVRDRYGVQVRFLHDLDDDGTTLLSRGTDLCATVMAAAKALNERDAWRNDDH